MKFFTLNFAKRAQIFHRFLFLQCYFRMLHITHPILFTIALGICRSRNQKQIREISSIFFKSFRSSVHPLHNWLLCTFMTISKKSLRTSAGHTVNHSLWYDCWKRKKRTWTVSCSNSTPIFVFSCCFETTFIFQMMQYYLVDFSK